MNHKLAAELQEGDELSTGYIVHFVSEPNARGQIRVELTADPSAARVRVHNCWFDTSDYVLLKGEVTT